MVIRLVVTWAQIRNKKKMTSCFVCGRALEGGEEVNVTRCGHCFHADCLSFSLRRSNQCPECDRNITEADIRRVYFDSPSTRRGNPPRDQGNISESQNAINQMLTQIQENNRRDVSTLCDSYELENYYRRNEPPVLHNHGVLINCNEYSPEVVNIDIALPFELLLRLFAL